MNDGHGPNSTHLFESTVRQHQAMVFSLAYHFLQDAAAAEDVAQEVFVQLYRNFRSIQSPEHLRFWLRKVTVASGLVCVGCAATA